MASALLPEAVGPRMAKIVGRRNLSPEIGQKDYDGQQEQKAELLLTGRQRDRHQRKSAGSSL